MLTRRGIGSGNKTWLLCPPEDKKVKKMCLHQSGDGRRFA